MIAELLKHPEDMEVALIDDLYNDLDYGIVVGEALDFGSTRPDGRSSWAFPGNPKAKGFDGRDVLVIY